MGGSITNTLGEIKEKINLKNLQIWKFSTWKKIYLEAKFWINFNSVQITYICQNNPKIYEATF